MTKRKRDNSARISLVTVWILLSAVIIAMVIWIVAVEFKTQQPQLSNDNTGHPDIMKTQSQLQTSSIPAYDYKMETTGIARTSIIIDDLGWNLEMAKTIIDIDAPITLAIIPKLKFSREIAEYGKTRGREIIMHVPMEPHDRNGNPQDVPPLLTSMNRNTISEMVSEYLSEVPYAVGANNHMGSRFTEDKKSMSFFLNALKKKGLFFVDSLTTSKSVAYKTAMKLGIPSVRRNVFLDHEVNINSIRERAAELERILDKKHIAIGIGHPHQETVTVLQELVERLRKKEIMIVPVSELMPIVLKH